MAHRSYINKIEFLEDRIKFHFHLTRESKSDVDGEREISYDCLRKFPKLPKDLSAIYGHGTFYKGKEIYVEKINKTIVFYFHVIPSCGLNDESLLGPFLKE